jgi:hypothetical protein
MYYLVLALGVIATVVFLILRVKRGGVDAAISKAFASLLFILTAIAACASSGAADDIFNYFVIGGLVLGLLGDIWLDLKWVYPESNDKYTFTGFISFGIGHIFFLAGLFMRFADFSKSLYIILPVILAAFIGFAITLMEKPLKLVYGKFKAISGIYGGILVFMTLLSGSLALMNDFNVMTLNFMFIGGVLFLISDLILSGTYFGEGKNRPIDVITNHVSYYAAQFVIASSLLFLAA